MKENNSGSNQSSKKSKLNSKLRGPVVVFALLTVTAVLAYQNCATAIMERVSRPSKEEFLASASLTINQSEPFTNDPTLTLALNIPSTAGAVQMMVSESADNRAAASGSAEKAECGTVGQWEPLAPKKEWMLKSLNQKSMIQVALRNQAGDVLPCLTASITHDDVPPKIALARDLGPFSKNQVEDVDLRGSDSGSGILQYECRFTGETAFRKCQEHEKLSILAPASTFATFQVRAIDKAGNRSELLEKHWLIDRTPPVLTILDRPQGTMAQSYVHIRMEASDESNGSGLDKIRCTFDSGPVRTNCRFNETIQSLAPGAHLFVAWAVDRAGNESPKQQVMWTVGEDAALGFFVIGISSSSDAGADIEIDKVLSTSAIPRVHWTPMPGAIKYRVSILNEVGSALVCKVGETASTFYSFSPRDCQLQDGQRYKALVTGYGRNGMPSQAPLFAFSVDTTPPPISISAPILSADRQSATLKFAVGDLAGVRQIMCRHTAKGVDQLFNCKDLTSVTFTNLSQGEHAFTIIASDAVQNTGTSTPVTWSISPSVYNPFINPFHKQGQETKKSLRGTLLALNEEQRKSPPQTIAKFFETAASTGALLYFSQLFHPPQRFTAGFTSSDMSMIRDEKGRKITDGFAIELETVMKLTANDQPGLYQFALLAADGTTVEMKDASGQWQPLLVADGEHETNLTCDKTGIQLDSISRVPLRIRQFHGTKNELALSLLWRKREKTESLDDEACEKSGAPAFFGSSFKDMESFEYGRMSKRGWRVPASDNYLVEDDDLAIPLATALDSTLMPTRSSTAGGAPSLPAPVPSLSSAPAQPRPETKIAK